MAFKFTSQKVEKTRNTTARPEIVEISTKLLDPAFVDEEENDIVSADMGAPDDVLAPVGSKAWMDAAQAEAGAVRTYITKNYGEQLKARGLQCSTKRYDNFVRVGLIPDPKLVTIEPEAPTGEQEAA